MDESGSSRGRGKVVGGSAGVRWHKQCMHIYVNAKIMKYKEKRKINKYIYI
jgi:hypothetical protein